MPRSAVFQSSTAIIARRNSSPQMLAVAISGDPSHGQDSDNLFHRARNASATADSCIAAIPPSKAVQYPGGFHDPARWPSCSDDVAEQTIVAVCRWMQTLGCIPTLDALAEKSGLSATHWHKLFKCVTGMTPRAYAYALCSERVRVALSSAATVTTAMYDAAFNSSGSFYECAASRLGMPANDYRKRGTNQTIRFAVGESSLGAVLVAATVKGTCAILLGDDPEYLLSDLQQRFARADLVGADATLEQYVAQAVGVVENPARPFTLPLDMQGTVFQHRVWQVLREIPCGTTASYLQLAQKVGAPKALRAVAQACAANPLAVVIPCHRVIRSDGNLSGYRWGIQRKRELLLREGVELL